LYRYAREEEGQREMERGMDAGRKGVEMREDDT